MSNYNINPNRNYKRLSTGWVHTGKQIINLLELAKPELQAIVLLDIIETDEPAGKPDDKYGVPG